MGFNDTAVPAVLTGNHCGPEIGFWDIQYSREPKFGNTVSGVFTLVLAKHSKSFLTDSLHLGGRRLEAEELRVPCESSGGLATK